MRRLPIALVLAGTLAAPAHALGADYDPATGTYVKQGSLRAGVVKSGCTDPLKPCTAKTVYASVRKRTSSSTATFTLRAQYLTANRMPVARTVYVHQVKRVNGRTRYVRLLQLSTSADGTLTYAGMSVRQRGEFLVSVWTSPRRMVSRQTVKITLDKRLATRFADAKNFLTPAQPTTPPDDEVMFPPGTTDPGPTDGSAPAPVEQSPTSPPPTPGPTSPESGPTPPPTTNPSPTGPSTTP